ncbi:MAG: FHA domain-containing protein [Dehalococcoidia bacterium]
MVTDAALLVVEKGSEDASVIPLDQPSHLIGKLPYSDISFNNPYVSRRHAQILSSRGRYQIDDLGSKNGTYINGTQLVEGPRLLANGDRIELGRDQVVLRFQTWNTTITLATSEGGGKANSIKVDPRSREVWVQGIQVEPRLSRKEFDVLELLHQRKGEACSKDEIAFKAWPERSSGDVGDQEIEQCIRRLRIRVESDPSQPQYILNIRGYGYKLSTD